MAKPYTGKNKAFFLIVVLLNLVAEGEAQQTPQSKLPEAAVSTVPSSEEVERFYRENISFFARPARAEIYQIVIRIPKTENPEIEAKIRDSAEQLARRKDIDLDEFKRIASRHSEDIFTRDEGGRIGWVEEGITTGELGSLLFPKSSKEPMGLINHPVQISPDQLAIVFVSGRRAGDSQEIDAVVKKRVMATMSEVEKKSQPKGEEGEKRPD